MAKFDAYQRVEEYLKQHPGASIAEACRKLDIRTNKYYYQKNALQDKDQGKCEVITYQKESGLQKDLPLDSDPTASKSGKAIVLIIDEDQVSRLVKDICG